MILDVSVFQDRAVEHQFQLVALHGELASKVIDAERTTFLQLPDDGGQALRHNRTPTSI